MSARRERKVTSGSTNRSDAVGSTPRLELALSARSAKNEIEEPVAASRPPKVPELAGALRRKKSYGSAATSGHQRIEDQGAKISEATAKALQAADEQTARRTKFVLGVLRDRFLLRTQFTSTFRRLDVNKSGRIERDEMNEYLNALSCPVDDGVLDLVMMQLDSDGEKGIKLSELVENLLRMGAWGSHDPFMSSAMRADATDAKLAQVRAHDEMQQLVEARRALRMATTAKGLHTTLHKAGSGRPTGGGEAEAEPSALEAMYQSRAASAASALFSKPPDPLAGTLSRAEFEATLAAGSSGGLGSTTASRLGLASAPLYRRGTGALEAFRSANSTGGFGTIRPAAAMATDEQLGRLAPQSRKRLDVEKFCVSLAEPPPAALGYGLSLPAGDRRTVALPRLPGKLARFVMDDDLRARVENEFRLNDQRIRQNFTLSRPREAPLLVPQAAPFSV